MRSRVADGPTKPCAVPSLPYAVMVIPLRRLRPLTFVSVLAACSLAVVAAIGSSNDASASERNVSSFSSAPITVYGAKWCSACRTLERGLTDRKIAFDVVDVDDNPAAFAKAKTAAGAGGAIPLTGVVRSSDTVWIVGANVDAVERASRGE
jgi:mycoredoxin